MTFDADLEYSDSIYSPEEYDKLTEGKFGKEIFVLHNSNDSDDNNSIIIDEPELRSKIHCNDFSEYVIKAVKKTVKCEDALIRQILYTGFSSYIEDDPINLGIIAPTSEGKTYPVEETMKFFPRSDVYKIGSTSTKALVREKGILVDKCNEPLEERLKELREQKNTAKNKEEKEQTSDQIKELYEDAKTLIDLRGKILVFLEPPDKEVWDILKPILSHDSFEIEFPFVDKNERDGLYTKKVVVKGWPSCIFCSAKDESKWEIWPEVQSRFLISSPNMVPQKYRESTKLIASRKGLPNLIQQQTIISDTEIELAKQCVLLIKQKIKELKTKNKDNKISIWIPYNQLLERELPANKGTDVRIQKRIFSLLNIVPIVKFNLRKLLVLGDETSIIADLDDLKEVLSISHNFEGIPKYKIEFFNNIFYPLYKSKTEPDSNADASKKEDRKAVTARQLCDFYKEKIGKIINTDRLKKTYLDELANNGLIDLEISKIHAQQYIYYPIVEPLSCYNNSINDNDESSSSFSSKVEQFDQVSQYSFTIYKKIIKNITEQWLFYEIIRLLSHRIDVSNIRGQLADHLNKYEEFQLLDNRYESNLENTNKDIEAKKRDRRTFF